MGRTHQRGCGKTEQGPTGDTLKDANTKKKNKWRGKEKQICSHASQMLEDALNQKR